MEALPQSYKYTVLTILESALAHDLNICHIRHTLAFSPIQSPEYRPVHLQRQRSRKREHPIFGCQQINIRTSFPVDNFISGSKRVEQSINAIVFQYRLIKYLWQRGSYAKFDPLSL